jgi:hypothetical protein
MFVVEMHLTSFVPGFTHGSRPGITPRCDDKQWWSCSYRTTTGPDTTAANGTC